MNLARLHYGFSSQNYFARRSRFPKVNDSGQPLHSLLAAEFGVTFVAGYVASYMLVSMGIFNVILAVYVDITMKALPFETGGSRHNQIVMFEHCHFSALLGWLAVGYVCICHWLKMACAHCHPDLGLSQAEYCEQRMLYLAPQSQGAARPPFSLFRSARQRKRTKRLRQSSTRANPFASRE